MTTDSFTATEEQVARILAESRGVDPDQPVTIGKPDGTVEDFEIAWHGYVPTARSIIAALGA